MLKFVRTPIWERDKVNSDDTFRAKVNFSLQCMMRKKCSRYFGAIEIGICIWSKTPHILVETLDITWSRRFTRAVFLIQI